MSGRNVVYLCFGKVGWRSVCQPFLYTFVSFRAWFREEGQKVRDIKIHYKFVGYIG